MSELVAAVVAAVVGVVAGVVVKDWKKVYDTCFRSIPSRIWCKWKELRGRRMEAKWERERLERIAACDHPEGKVGGVVGKIVCSKCGEQRECTHHNLQSAIGKTICSECGKQEECTHHNLQSAIGKTICSECGKQEECTHPIDNSVYWTDNVRTCTCGTRMNGFKGRCDICGGKGVLVLQRTLHELSEDEWWERFVEVHPQTCLNRTECEERVKEHFGALPKVGELADLFRKDVTERQIYRELSMAEHRRERYCRALCTLLGHENGHALESAHVCIFTLYEHPYYGKVLICCCGSKQETQENEQHIVQPHALP